MSDVVERAKAALEGVSDGPWRWEPSKYIRSGYVITAQNRTALHAADWNADYGPFPEQFNHADANFAAEARSLVPELIAEVERLTPRRIETAEQLDTLPHGSLVVSEYTSAAGWNLHQVWERRNDSWFCLAAPLIPPSGEYGTPSLPVIAVYEPKRRLPEES